MIRIYCDFDGTVCPTDVGEEFFRFYLGTLADDIVKPLLNGEIGGKELLLRECKALPSLTYHDVEQYALRFSLDPYFAPFTRFCEERSLALTIVSDGLDIYINALLRQENLSHIPVYANRAQFLSGDGTTRLAVSFPYTDEECHECGNCKRNHMLVQSADEDIIVYVGDGYSDRCPVQFADYVFAKRHLIPFCQERNITYFEFKHFGDVQQKIEMLLSRKRLRHRLEASKARKQVFMQG